MKKTTESLKGLSISIGIAILCFAVAVSVYMVFIQPGNLHWGLDKNEASRHFPGDELLPRPDYISTHAVTIDATVEKVWPWLVQIGQNRGGYYSYTWIENLFGFRMRNANRIVPQWQTLSVGDEINLAPHSSMVVRAIETAKHIVCDMPMGDKTTWAFYLEPLDAGKSRLLSRLRMNTGGDSWWALALFDPGHFIMDRKMLTGIRERVERQTGKSSLFAVGEWGWGIVMILCGLAIPVLFFYHHRPWNGISAGVMGILWIIGMFCSYASMIAAVAFAVLGVLAFVIPRRLRAKIPRKAD